MWKVPHARCILIHVGTVHYWFGKLETGYVGYKSF